MDPNISSQPIQPVGPMVQPPVTQAVQPTPVVQNLTPQNPQPAVSPNIPSRATYRLSAVLIDGGVVLGLWSAVCLLMAFIFNVHIAIKDANTSPLITVYSLVGGIVNVVYFSYFHAHDGATPGKKVYGLRVVAINTSSKLTYAKSLLRELVKAGIGMVPIIGGLLNLANGGLVVFSKTKQGIHDSLVKSQVIEVGKPLSLWKQLLLYLLLISFWAVSVLILIVFIFSIGPK
jgi:uncharacterized RDD family membrane protein YckC